MNSLLVGLLVVLQAVFGIPIWILGWFCAFIHNYFSLGFMGFYEYFEGEEDE